MICLTIFCLDKIQIQNAPSVGLCQRTWRLSTASALEDISQFKTMPRIGQTQAKTQACEQCTVVADWLSQSGSQGRGWNNVRGAVDVEVCECNFFIRLFLCQHPLASPALHPPAGLVVSPFPSPAARHSRSQAALRGRTEGNLKGTHKEGKKERGKE